MRTDASAWFSQVLLWSVMMAGCVSAPASNVPGLASVRQPTWGSPTPLSQSLPYQRGVASYYADFFSGRLTANGEVYRPNLFTAAHRTLPFGTVLDVVRPDGRAVRVRVNDRGPYHEGRIIDLSRAAADALGMTREGVGDVALYLIYWPPRPESSH